MQICLLINAEKIIYRKLRTGTHGQILINLSLSLIGVYIFFLICGHVTSVPALCGICAALLQYFLLVFFGWTEVEAVWLYLNPVSYTHLTLPTIYSV